MWGKVTCPKEKKNATKRKNKEKKSKSTDSNALQKVEFFSDATIKVPLFNFQYLFEFSYVRHREDTN